MKKRMMKIVVALGMTAATLATQAKMLPEFMNTQQLAAWRAQYVAPAAAAVQAPNEQNSFFTGKPYDLASGTYLFKYRTYSPALARWTSADPSGYPDGANNFVYVNNCVSGKVDPSGRDIWTQDITLAGSIATLTSYTSHWTETFDNEAMTITLSGPAYTGVAQFLYLKADDIGGVYKMSGNNTTKTYEFRVRQYIVATLPVIGEVRELAADNYFFATITKKQQLE